MNTHEIKDESFTTGMLRCSQRKTIPVWRVYRTNDNTCVFTGRTEKEARQALKEITAE